MNSPSDLAITAVLVLATLWIGLTAVEHDRRLSTIENVLKIGDRHVD